MALNKKEQAEFERLKKELGEAKALRYPSYPRPKPRNVKEMLDKGEGVSLGEYGGKVLVGWFQHNYDGNFRVSKGCSSYVSHSTNKTDKTDTQTTGVQYATRLEALQKARWDMTERFAATLARIDDEIQKEFENPTP